jgi:pSer/pThr/pTyr-binding forkhead associated (FHA) protein
MFILARQETGMSFKLSVRQGPRPNLVFELDKDSYTVGREAGNEIVIEDPQVSRRHAQLTRQGTSYLLEDIGSTNGTYVNGKRVTAPVLLNNGDLVGLADTVVLAVQAPSTAIESEATLVMGEVAPVKPTVPPTLPAFTPPPVQERPTARPTGYAPPPSYTPQPSYVPPPQPYASQPVPAVTADRRRTILIGVGCLALLLIVCAIGFIAWSFIDCPSFSSVFPFLFPPFSCA